jgi:type III secretion protein Q
MLSSAAVQLHPSAAPPLASAAAHDECWLPKIAAEDVALLNALYRSRRPLEAQIGDYHVTIETVAHAPVDADARSFDVMLAGRAAQLRVPRRLIALCMRQITVDGADEPDLDRFGAVQAGMLLEFALLRAIKALETALRSEIRIEQRSDAIDRAFGEHVQLHAVIRGLPTGDADLSLSVDRASASAIARALDALATPNVVTDRLAVTMRLCVDSIDLTLAELRTLRAGDIVLPENQRQPGRIIGVVAEHLRCEIERAGERFRLVSSPVHARAHARGEWFMQHPADAIDTSQRASIDEGLLEQLPVRLVFEVGRLDLPLTELRRLAPGYLLPLTRPTESAVDVMANGRKIGQGSLVKIGDSIGVRVERLLADE